MTKPFAVLLTLVCLAGSAAAVHAAEGEKPVRVLLTYGGHGFEEAAFFAMFDAMEGIEYVKAQLPDEADLLKPGLQERFDVIVRYDMVGKFTPEQEAQYQKLMQEGIGLVALHHNLGAHRTWPEYREIIGGAFLFEEVEIDGKKYGKSGWAHGQDMEIAVEDADHPITRGIGDFRIHDEVYNNYYTSPKVHLLLSTDHPKNDPSIMWTHRYGKSRVVYLMLGHDSHAWRQPEYPKLVLQAIRWTAER